MEKLEQNSYNKNFHLEKGRTGDVQYYLLHSQSCNPFGPSLGDLSALVVGELPCLDVDSVERTPLPIVLLGSWLHLSFSFPIFFCVHFWSVCWGIYLHLKIFLSLSVDIHIHLHLHLYLQPHLYLYLSVLTFCFYKFRSPRVVLRFWTKFYLVQICGVLTL